MLPQLVGMSCGVCSQRIGSEIDGRFCEGCGNPIHNKCGPPPQPVSNDELLSSHEQPKCARCGCDPKAPVACHVREVWLYGRVVKETEERLPVLEPYLTWRKRRRMCVIGGWTFLLFGGIPLGLMQFSRQDGEVMEMPPTAIPFVVFGFGLLLISSLAGWLERLGKQIIEEDDKKEPPG